VNTNPILNPKDTELLARSDGLRFFDWQTLLAVARLRQALFGKGTSFTMNCLHCVLAVLLATHSATANDAAVERWDRAICLHTERKSTDGQPTVASGFVVDYKESLWLVSAVHVAQDTHARTRVVYRTSTGESRWVHLGGLTETEKTPWSDFENSDVSIARMHDRVDTTIYYGELKQLAIPFDALIAEVPKRTKKIEITGYPMSFGTTPPVAPLAIVADVASRNVDCGALGQ